MKPNEIELRDRSHSNLQTLEEKKNMTIRTDRPFGYARTGIVAIAFVLVVLTGSVFADDIKLDMEGTTATIPKGNTVTRKIYGIPSFGGSLKIRYKWHALNVIPNTFNALRVEIKKGSTLISSKTSCFSTHSNKTPKCDLTQSITNAQAEAVGNWTIVITNNSNDEVFGFNIEKGSDINPLVPNFRSVYTPNCPNTVNLDMEGAGTATITKGGIVNRKLYGIGKSPGVLVLRAKWHAVNVILNTFNPLKIDLIKPNGTVAQGGTFYSFHSNKSPKLDLIYNISATDAALAGTWSLRITNNSNDETVGFDITKGNDINPLVPSFNSTYKAKCP
jgi:hypothetical protein